MESTVGDETQKDVRVSGPTPASHRDSATARQSDDWARYDPTVPSPSPGVYDIGNVTRLEVAFPSDGFRLAGHLYLSPTRAGRGDERPPGVVLDGPMMSIKRDHRPRLRNSAGPRGYEVLTFDRRGWGNSEGTVRQHMNPPDNVRDIRNATTYLLSRDEIDPERMAGVGVCAGGGFMLQAGAVDRRFRAVAVIGAFYGSRRQMRDDLGHEGWIEQMRTMEAPTSTRADRSPTKRARPRPHPKGPHSREATRRTTSTRAATNRSRPTRLGSTN
jgi:pimeloyl-ACP methyl ester carboxylesterase